MFSSNPVQIIDPLEDNGGVPVNMQDQHSEVLFLPISIEVNSGNLLASGISIDVLAMTLTPGHGATVGNIICMKESGHFYHAGILTVSTNDITVDTPTDFAFTTAAEVRIGNANLNVDGSSAIKTAFIQPPPNTKWDVTRIHLSILDNVDMDSNKFGGITKLTKGVVIRVHNGVVKNLLNVKTNGDLIMASSWYSYDPKAPAGVFGFASNHVLAGQSHVGVTIRLDGDLNEQLRVLIQDDLRDLSSFNVVAIGHVVTD